MVYQWIINNLSRNLPQACCLCGASSHPLGMCSSCQHDLPQLDPAHICARCARPTTQPAQCGHCLRQPPAYDRVIAGFAYAEPLSQLVSQLKFRGRLQLARLFGELLAERISGNTIRVQALLPVPLHRRRLGQRGFNQALEIARPLARACQLPILNSCVSRQRDTRPQSEQSRELRGRNVRGAFALHRQPGFDAVAIVDDVMTSGHTVNEIARLLRQSGVGWIEVWCLARAGAQI